MADYPIETAAARSPRRTAWLDVALILVAAAAMLALPAPDAGGAVAAQLMVPLRMLLLVAAATRISATSSQAVRRGERPAAVSIG